MAGENGLVNWGGVGQRLRGWRGALWRPWGPPPRPSRRAQLFDLLLAGGLALAAILAGPGDDTTREMSDGLMAPLQPLPPAHFEVPEQPAWALVLVLVAAPLVWRRRYPLAVLWAILASAPWLNDYQSGLRLSFLACVVAGYSAAIYSPYRVPALASLVAAAALYSGLQSDAVPALSNDSVPFLILLPIAVTALGLLRWKDRADAGIARVSAMERERIEAVRRATEHERARIAQELHDVLTHSVSVMVIQAGAARTVLRSSPEQAREALLAVEASGRTAMTDLRHVMGLLTMEAADDTPPGGPALSTTQGGGTQPAPGPGGGTGPAPAGPAAPLSLGPAELAPQPGLDGLDELVGRVRDTGMPVRFTVTGQPRPVPAGVQLAVYRLVQESLTNTLKHAAGASATVLIEYRPEELWVEVTDTGGVPGPAAGSGTGRGLIGLRERLAVYGAPLQSGPTPDGGYRIATLIGVQPT